MSRLDRVKRKATSLFTIGCVSQPPNPDSESLTRDLDTVAEDEAFLECLSGAQARKDLRTIAVLEYESDWARVEILTPGTSIFKLGGLGPFEKEIYSGVTITSNSLEYSSFPTRFVSGAIPFIIISNGDPIDIMITHGRYRRCLGIMAGRASVYFSGVTYATKSNGSTTNPKTFTGCQLICENAFNTPAILCYETDWAQVRADTPGTLFRTLPGFDKGVTIGDLGRSIKFDASRKWRSRPQCGVIPFSIVHKRATFGFTVTHRQYRKRSGDIGERAWVQVGAMVSTDRPALDLPPEPNYQPQSTPNSSSIVPGSSTPLRIYALIIGIDDYLFKSTQLRPLSGAVADADDMYNFCKTVLHVPEERIRNLRNEQATRANTISAIQALGDNPSIQNDDPILIYYAGHGSQVQPPERWPAKGLIQMLLPYNFNPKSTMNSPIENQGILDLQLSRLLDDVANKKSNNITFISDSCHSSSLTRTGERAAVRSVTLAPNYSVSEALVNESVPIAQPRASSVGRNFSIKGLSSHVLLAACTEWQQAHENQGRGAFTSALLGMLRERGGIEGLSYTDVILRLPKLRNPADNVQNPQCEGVHQYRNLFDSRVPSLKRQTFEIVGVKNKQGVYKLYAGEAEGIMPDATFAVYSNRDLDGEPLGYVQPVPLSQNLNGVEAAQRAFTICRNKPDSAAFSLESKMGYAIQTDAGTSYMVRFFLDLEPEHKAVFERAQERLRTKYAWSPQVEFVRSREDDPDLVVTAVGSFAIFEIMDPDCRQAGQTHIPVLDIPFEDRLILRILRAAAHFYFHLRRASKHSSYHVLSANVDLKCHKLVYQDIQIPGSTEQVLLPVDDQTSLIEDGVLVFPSDEDKLYGYSVTSKFDDGGLYAALFYFDMSDLSISQYYLPNRAQRGGSVYSIPPGGKPLTIGYGESGTAPRFYKVAKGPGQGNDVGFLRLFVSTDYADWTMIEQETPFSLIGPRMSNTGIVQKAVVGWGAKTVLVVVSQGKPEIEEGVGGGFREHLSPNSAE